MAIAALKRLGAFFALILIGIFLGFATSVHYISQHQWCCLQMKSFTEKTLSFLLNANVSTQRIELRIFPLKIVMHDICISSKSDQKSWQISAKQGSSACSLMKFLSNRMWHLSIFLKDGRLVSGTDKRMPFFFVDLMKLFEGDVQLPISLAGLQARNFEIEFNESDDDLKYKLRCNVSVAKKLGNSIISINTSHLNIYKAEQAILCDGAGDCTVTLDKATGEASKINLNAKLGIPALTSAACNIEAECLNGRAQAVLLSDDSNLHFSLFNNAHGEHVVRLSSPLATPVAAFAQIFKLKIPKIDGFLNAHIYFANGAITRLEADCSKCIFDSVSLPDMSVRYNANENTEHGVTTLSTEWFLQKKPVVTGVWRYYYIDQVVAGTVWSTTSLPVPFTKLICDSGAIGHCRANFKNSAPHAYATYQLFLKRDKSTEINDQFKLSGVASYENDIISLTAHAAEKTAYACIDHRRPYGLTKFSLKDAGNTIVEFAAESKQDRHATIRAEYQQLTKIFETLFDIQLHQQQATITGTLSEKTLGLIDLDVTVTTPALRLGTTHNFIKESKASLQYDYEKSLLKIKKADVRCEQGIVSISNGSCIYNINNGAYSICLPLRISQVFIDPFPATLGTVSGIATYKKTDDDNGSLDAFLLLERSHLKQNPFSYRTLFAPSINSTHLYQIPHYRMTIQTAHPLTVKTSFVEAQIQLHLAIEGDKTTTKVGGRCLFMGGALHFPYKPLHIKSGTVVIDRRDIKRSALLLTAEARIRGFLVQMHVSGTLENPVIEFESSPPLTKEQIITLLLTGSEEGSLALIMPSLLMQNLNAIMFGPDQPTASLDSQFKRMLIPFKNMRIIPHFTNQNARGGVRGGIEIEVNEQLRAVIQKNINLTEDTRIEVEYALADDLTARALKDERGDVGAEVELRWRP